MAARPFAPPLSIRDMTSDDVPAAARVLVSGGWPERTAFFRHLLGLGTCQPLVGEVDGEIVGTGVAAVCGTVGWVGTIFVNPTFRRRGYGEAITDAVCRRLEAAGCETLALIASDFGRPIYERMGFRIDAWHAVYEASRDGARAVNADAEDGTDLRLRRAVREDLPAIAAIDARATASDRSALLLSLVERTWVVERRGEVLGFRAVIEDAWGSIVAPESQVARILLSHARGSMPGGGTTHAAIVEADSGPDPERDRLLADLGWRHAFRTPRMLRGPAVDWRPGRIWGILGPAFG